MGLVRKAVHLPSLALAAALVASFFLLYLRLYGEFTLDVGSLVLPTQRFLVMGLLLATLGSLVTLSVTRALLHVRSRWPRELLQTPERRLRTLLVVLPCCLVLLVQWLLLRNGPLTDDEGAYLFSARLLADLKLWAPSPPHKLFFDNAFLINDGRLFSQYFLGWPALLALGEVVGLGRLVNPLLAALTVLGVFAIAQRWWGRRWALLSALFLAASPMFLVGSATLLSHTATTCWFVWTIWAALGLRGRGASPRLGLWAALCLCLCFFCRPQIALTALPVLAWAFFRWGRSAWRPLAWFALVAVPLAALFLFVNREFTGDFLTTPYRTYTDYTVSNGLRFGPWASAKVTGLHAEMQFDSLSSMLGLQLVALLRLGVDAFGWPCSFVLALAARGRRARLLLGLGGTFFAVHLAMIDGGIDSFGPVHYFELLPPLALLSAAGLRAVAVWGRRHALRGLPFALTAGLFTVTVCCFLPLRWSMLARISQDVRRPLEFVEKNVPAGSIVFSGRNPGPACAARPGHPFVYFRPNNRPDLSDDVLWVNHVSLARDRQLMASFPTRKGFLYVVSRSCEMQVVPLEQAPEKLLPDVAEQPGDFPASGG